MARAQRRAVGGQVNARYAMGWVLLILGLVFLSGVYVGKEHSWSYLDYATVERRMREVFCEQALHNGALKKCDPNFVRLYNAP